MSNKEKCIACLQIPDELLQLSCSHCVCLQCATKHIEKGTNILYSITCLRCEEKTDLSEDIFAQLAPYKKQGLNKRQKVLNKEVPLKNYHWGEESYIGVSLDRNCEAHGQYAVMYICKTCNDVFICPECVINGSHKNHSTILIQKEGEWIKRKLQQQLTRLNAKIEEVGSMQAKRLCSIGQRKRQLEKLKNKAIKQYKDIKEAISREESIVVAKCNQLIASHQEQQANFQMQMAAQIQSYECRKIDLIELLNPLLEESIKGENRGLNRMLMINLVQSYRALDKIDRKNRTHQIKIVQDNVSDYMDSVDSLTKKINNIHMDNFYKAGTISKIEKQERKQYSILQAQNTQSLTCKFRQRERQKKQTNQIRNDFFRLL